MNALASWIRLAALVQIGIVVANFFLPGAMDLSSQLSRLSRLSRQIFLVHWGYILLVLLLFAGLSLRFAEDLAGGSALGRAVCGALAVFWGLRLPVQLLIYDRSFRRKHRTADALFVTALLLLVVVYAIGAVGAGS